MSVKRKRSPASAQSAKKAATIKPKNDGATVRRGITIKAPAAEVKRLWKQKDFPGKAEFTDAPGDRGTELRVNATAKQQRAIEELVTAFQAKSRTTSSPPPSANSRRRSRPAKSLQ